MRRHDQPSGALALVVADRTDQRICHQPGAVTALLDPDEALLGWCHVSPVALEPAVLPGRRPSARSLARAARGRRGSGAAISAAARTRSLRPCPVTAGGTS